MEREKRERERERERKRNVYQVNPSRRRDLLRDKINTTVFQF